MTKTITKFLAVAAFAIGIASPAAASGPGCVDTVGELILEKPRRGATGPQVFGCFERSFDTISLNTLSTTSAQEQFDAIALSTNAIFVELAQVGIDTATLQIQLDALDSDKVDRAGDSMTGNLTMTNGSEIIVNESDDGNAGFQTTCNTVRCVTEHLLNGVVGVQISPSSEDNYFSGSGDFIIGGTVSSAKLTVVGGGASVEGDIKTLSGSDKVLVMGATSPGPTGIQAQNDAAALGPLALNGSRIEIYKGSVLALSISEDGSTTIASSVTINSGDLGLDNNTMINFKSFAGIVRPVLRVNASDQVILNSQDGVISFQISGQGEARIDNNGNFGIGTTSPDNKLDVHEDVVGGMASVIALTKSRANGVIITGDDLGDIDFKGHDGTNDNTIAAKIRAESEGVIATNRIPTSLQFFTSEGSGDDDISEKMRISPEGNVGIGTDSPGAGKLHILANGQTVIHTQTGTGDILFDSRNADNAGRQVVVFGNTADHGYLNIHQSDGLLTTHLDSTADSYLNGASVRLGIGTDSPGSLLHVQAGEATDAEFSLFADNGDDNADKWRFIARKNGIFRISNDAETGDGIVFLASTTVMALMPNGGNVGIGTASPGATLDVNGSAQFGSGATKSTFTAAGNLNMGGNNIHFPQDNGTISTTESIIIDIDSDNTQTDKAFTITHDMGTLLFKVEENGNVTITSDTLSVHGIAYNFPDSQGSINQSLINDGAGNLTWGAGASGGHSISDGTQIFVARSTLTFSTNTFTTTDDSANDSTLVEVKTVQLNGFRHTHGGGSQTLASGFSTEVVYSNQIYDDGNNFTTSVATITSSGLYSCSCSIRFETNGSGVRDLSINNRNIGASIKTLGFMREAGDGTDGNFMNVAGTGKFAVGDEITCDAFQNSGSTLILNQGASHSFSCVQVSQ